MPGSLGNTEKVIVDVGTGYMVEKVGAFLQISMKYLQHRYLLVNIRCEILLQVKSYISERESRKASRKYHAKRGAV